MAPHHASAPPVGQPARPLKSGPGRLSARLYTLGRLGLAGVFAVSGVVKSFSAHDFARIIGDYGLIPAGLLFPAALFLIACELAAGLGLLFEVRHSLTLASTLLAVFMGVLSYARFLGLDVDCGCFGPSAPERLYHADLLQALARDAALLALAAWLALHQHRARTAQRSPWPPFRVIRHPHPAPSRRST